MHFVVSDSILRELMPRALMRDGATPAFRWQRLRIDARAQRLVALLRHSLRQGIAEPLKAESLALTLARRALGLRASHAPGASFGRQRLADRTKLVLASDPARRWTLAEIAAEVGHPPFISRRYSSRSKASTLIVWGTDDMYFDVKWSRWLADAIPGTRRRVELEGARLFFPEERWDAFNQELRAHWQAAGSEPGPHACLRRRG